MEPTPTAVGPLTSRLTASTRATNQPSDTKRIDDTIAAAWRDVERSIGTRYADAKFSTFTGGEAQSKAAADVKAWAYDLPERLRQKAGGLILYGPRGTGKDHLAVAGLRVAALECGLSVAFVEGQTLFARARDLIDRELSEERWVRDYVSPKVLLISDPIPHAGKLTDYQFSILWRIVDMRYRRLHPTWITANVESGQEFDRLLGGPLADRLRDGALVVKCAWPSHRKAWESRSDGTFGKRADA